MYLSCPCSPRAQLSQQGWEAGPHLPVEQHLQQHPHWSFACSQVLVLLNKSLCSSQQYHPVTNLMLHTSSSFSRCLSWPRRSSFPGDVPAMQTEHDSALMGWKGCLASRQPYPENRGPRTPAIKESACDAPPWSEGKCRWLKSQFVLIIWFKPVKWSH